MARLLQLVKYEVETLQNLEYYYHQCGDNRNVIWESIEENVNFVYKDSSGLEKFGKAPIDWLYMVIRYESYL